MLGDVWIFAHNTVGELARGASLKGTYFSPPSAPPPLPWRFSLFLSLGALGVGVLGFGAWLSSCWASLFSDSVSPPWGDEVSLE